MENCQESQEVCVSDKKDYEKPVLTTLGKVTELTASGSEGPIENCEAGDADCIPSTRRG
jgi:hypothetical protein